MAVKKASTKKKQTNAKDSETSHREEENIRDEKTSSSADSDSTNKQQKNKGKATDQSENMASEAFRIVEQAASILEEEISAGIIAAKKVEERYVDVNSLRTGAPEHVMQRFRKDAHEVLDIMLDMVNLSVSALSGLSERAMSVRSASSRKNNAGANNDENLPELRLPKTLKPGESGRVSMLVENEEDSDSAPFSFSSSGLLSDTGEQLDSRHISFNPASLQVTANDLEKVVIHVQIPETASAGRYSGLLQAPELQIRAILTVQVEEE